MTCFYIAGIAGIAGIFIWLLRISWNQAAALRANAEVVDRLIRLENRLSRLEQELKGEARAAAPRVDGGMAGVSLPPAPAPPPRPAPLARPEPATFSPPAVAVRPPPLPSPLPPLPPLPQAAPVDAEPSPLQRRLAGLERAFAENWTGILGAIVVVAGVTFVGIYTALRLEPVYRFLMTVAAAGLLAGGAIYLRRQEVWRPLAQWVRSAAAAIFLFACAASGGLPGLGLQWLRDPAPALALLALGLAVNLAIAWTGGAQFLAALHVVLSLIPLAIVPPSTASLVIATVVALFGVALSLRARWDQHLLAVLAGYAVCHAAWYLRLGDALDATGLRALGAFCALAVFAAAALVHYRKDYASDKAEPLPLFVHLTSWTLLALALLVYPREAAVRGFALGLAGCLAYLLARRARALGIRWLYACDTLIGQALVLAALVSLRPLAANLQLVTLALFLETLLFLWLMVREREVGLSRVGLYGVLVTGMILITGGLPDAGGELAVTNQNALLLLIAAAAATLAYLYLHRRHGETLKEVTGDAIPAGAPGWLVGGLVIAAQLQLARSSWLEVVALAATGILLAVARWEPLPGLRAGTGAAAITAHLISWWILLRHQPWPAEVLAQHLGPLAALAALGIWLAGPSRLRQVAIWLLGLDLALAAYLFFQPVSPLIPGVVWLLLSLLALELANRLPRPSATSVLCFGYGYLAAFAGAYALVILQTPAYLGAISARLLIELLALGVIAYWWLYHPRQTLAEHPAWLRTQPLLLELGLLAMAVTGLVELPAPWQPIASVLLGLAMLAEPIARLDDRFKIYSLGFYWASVAGVTVILSTFESPSPRWYDRPEVMALVAIALQIAYVVASHARLDLAELRVPAGLGALREMGRIVAAHRNPWVYYPLFAGVALFLFWRFDRAVLTLLWVAEAFVVFVLSAMLRENMFRILALGALGICLFRLVVIDMAESNLGLRGVVFIGVGLLMLGMNAVYNRFRARFE